MLRELKKPQILLALTISLCLPILSTYFIYCDMADDNPFFAHATYENDDLDDFFKLPDSQSQLDFSKLIGSTALFSAFLEETNAIARRSLLCPLSSSLGQEILVLRC